MKTLGRTESHPTVPSHRLTGDSLMFSMDYKDISERISLLTQEIRDLQRMDTALHCDGSQRISRASRPKERELRLRQIREELSKMMLKPTREQ